MLFSTLAAVLDFADACPPTDDLTLLVVRRCEEAAKELGADAKKLFSTPNRRQVAAARAGRATNSNGTFAYN